MKNQFLVYVEIKSQNINKKKTWTKCKHKQVLLRSTIDMHSEVLTVANLFFFVILFIILCLNEALKLSCLFNTRSDEVLNVHRTIDFVTIKRKEFMLSMPSAQMLIT